MIQVEGNKNLFRDENTGAIVNMDTQGYVNYVNSRNKKISEKKQLDVASSTLFRCVSPGPYFRKTYCM